MWLILGSQIYRQVVASDAREQSKLHQILGTEAKKQQCAVKLS